MGNLELDQTVKSLTEITTETTTEIKEYIVEIVNYLNSTCEKNYRTSTKKTQTLIKARLAEGYVVEQFKKVIDIKKSHWFKDPNMDEYLRPETLFGTKFESYLNSKPKTKQNSEMSAEERLKHFQQAREAKMICHSRGVLNGERRTFQRVFSSDREVRNSVNVEELMKAMSLEEGHGVKLVKYSSQ